MNRKKAEIISLCLVCCMASLAQDAPLTLDSCRALALRYNKNIYIADEEVKAARYERKAAFSNYLPKLSAEGAYLHNNKRISLLTSGQHKSLQTIGDALHEGIGNVLKEIATMLPQPGEATALLSSIDIASPLNTLGNSISEALAPDTRNIYVAAVTVRQPIFAGGRIIAYNKLTRYAENASLSQKENKIQEIIVLTEEAYWQIVSLANKRKLATALVSMLEQLHSNVEKMKDEGVATQADLLNVEVRVNETRTALLQVENGEMLARMYLCRICGLPIDYAPTLADENNEELTGSREAINANIQCAMQNRPELKSLESLVEIFKQKTNIARAEYLPEIGLTANYMISNPSLTDGFRNRFRGMCSIGIVVNIPIWNWGEGIYKTAAAKAQTNIAKYTLADAREMIELQVHQSEQRVSESEKRLILATSNVLKAEENLRTANIGFAEGVLTSENVLEAQTAWLQAHSGKIDAQIDVILSRLYLKKALGILEP